MNKMIEQFRAVGVSERLVSRLVAATAAADEAAGQLEIEQVPLWLRDEEDDAIMQPFHEAVFDAIDACQAASPRLSS